MSNTLRILWTWLRHVHRSVRRSLRGRLLYALAGLLLLLAALEGIRYHQRVAERLDLLAGAQERAARIAANHVREGLAELFVLQRVVAQSTLTGRIPAEYIPALLEDYRRDDPGLVAVRIYGPDGTLRFASPVEGFAAPDPFLQQLSPQAPHAVSPRLEERPGDPEPRLRLASLVSSPAGEPLGIVLMEVRRSTIARLFAHRDDAPYRLLLDAAGRPIDSTPASIERAVLEDAELREAVANRRPREVRVRLRSADGSKEELIGFAAPVAGSGWTVVSLRPVSAAIQDLQEGTRDSLVLLLGVVAGLGLTLWLVVNSSLRPLIQVAAAARKLGSGDLTFRLPPAEIEEFEPLVAAFNRMASQLEAARRDLLETNRTLEERVAQRTRELEAEHQKLLRAERLSTLGLFSSAIAHDLRNPLNTISLSLQALKLRLADTADERVQRRLAAMEREVRRSEHIIRTLLGFARTGELELQPTHLNALICEVAEIVQPPEAIALKLDLDPDLPVVAADPGQMFQVLENLIRNAIQAMPEGGEVRVRSQRREGWIELSVSDTGPGIPEELQPTIFEPLVTTKSTGTGLGLPLCRRIVEAHGGRISLRSRPGAGATFLVELPIAEAPADAPPADTRCAGRV